MNEMPTATSLEDPLYYLGNFRAVVNWVQRHHSDLLHKEERQLLDNFHQLPVKAQALLARLVMRRPVLFRCDRLVYAELGQDIKELLNHLVRHGWLSFNPTVELSALFSLYTKAELQQLFSRELEKLDTPKGASKIQMFEQLAVAGLQPRSCQRWGLDGASILRLDCAQFFERLRLMFFGNLRQDWSAFVLSELGHQVYEPVGFDPDSRAFGHRYEIDCYLSLDQLRQQLEAGDALDGLLKRILALPAGNRWLEARKGRLLFQLGQQAERAGEVAIALQAYQSSGRQKAWVRRVLLLERSGSHTEAYVLARSLYEGADSDWQRRAVTPAFIRLCRKCRQTSPPIAPSLKIPQFTLATQPVADDSVETVAASLLRTAEGPVYYVENMLINGLFGLLCWPAIFAPLKGAFFHPFQVAPADLYREDFAARRTDLFHRCLERLDTSQYKTEIRLHFQEKQGVSNPFVNWRLLSGELLELALNCIPAAHLRAIFRRMLLDISNNCSGFPDLVQFWPGQARYCLIEVKGPGDRLQHNQREWFNYCLRQEIPVQLCHLQWEPSA